MIHRTIDSDTAIRIRGLSKAYTIKHGLENQSTLAEQALSRLRNPFKRATSETFWALRDIDLDIRKGDVVGIIGRNGAGKSTLLKVLSRITEPTTGEIDIYGRVGSLLEVGTGFHPELTGRENIYLNGAILGMTRPEIRKQFDAIVDFAGVERFLDTPVKRYSSGMYVRLAFAVAAHLKTDVLIIDEVLAVGDTDFQNKCLGKMQDVAGSEGRTVLFVSHNMALVQSICSRAVLLTQGELTAEDTTDRIVSRYLRLAATNEFRPKAGPVKWVLIRQIGARLRLEVEFDHPAPLKLPNLGFVIFDGMGKAIAGLNPATAEVAPPKVGPMKSGRVAVDILQPVLLDGDYHLSIWFGDGKEDFVALPNCLSFEVRGMAGHRQLRQADVGPVLPECLWSFESNMKDEGDCAADNEFTNAVSQSAE